jgi:septum formation protein
MKIILASQSPRRHEILQFLNIPFTVHSSNFNEDEILFTGCPISFVNKQSICKGQVVQKLYPKDVIISADTTVYFKNKLFQKPSSHQQAFEFIETLCGNTHSVFTSVSVLREKRVLTHSEETKVTFRDLEKDQIHKYIEMVHSLDKAGGYAIQGIGSLLVSKIEGCYYNVMGLPVQTLVKLLKEVDIDVWNFSNDIY